MASFSIVLEYLTGYAVATDPTSREKPEWPPHPARVFMAMAAAHFESDGAPEQKKFEREALEWLCALPAPSIRIPPHSARDVLDVFVPVNDQPGGMAVARRSRQPRTFPRVHVGDEPVRFIWHIDPKVYSTYIEAIRDICRNVTRVGHSSSLVWMRIEEHTHGLNATHEPTEDLGEFSLRSIHAGAMDRLDQAYNKQAIDDYELLQSQWTAAKGKEKSLIKGLLNEQFPQGLPTSQRPQFSMRTPYRPVDTQPDPTIAHGIFDERLIILRESEENEHGFGLESTALILKALRGLIMKSAPQPLPAWVSGHEEGGQDKLQSTSHMAMIPLAFVGSPYADGHLLGVGIVLPKNVGLRERARVLARVLNGESQGNHSGTADLKLTLGMAGTWIIRREPTDLHQVTLRPETYTQPSFKWATVTPIILDRMPKADRVKDPAGWRADCAQIIASSCQNIGLPSPIAVRVEKTPFFRGSLRAMPGQGGFPQLIQGRFQVHAQIEFPQLVRGPVLLGTGRFRGYGLCRPWRDDQR